MDHRKKAWSVHCFSVDVMKTELPAQKGFVW